jgi:hypothetical protein
MTPTDPLVDEVTPAMIEAGATAFCETQSLDPRKLARIVYTTMRAVSQEGLGASADADRATRASTEPQSALSLGHSASVPCVEGFAPCPFCHQYSHSIGGDQLAKAFMHFQSMYAHPMRGHPMGDIFDEQTQDAAQVLMTAARLAPGTLASGGDVQKGPRQ